MRKTNMNIYRTTILFFLILPAGHALAKGVGFSEEHWDIQGEQWELTSVAGQEALLLKGGVARLKDVGFENGIIEFDILFRQERGFSGGFWRMQDDANREEFYLRPHQSGQPDANQYQPVFFGNASWQLYHGPAHAAPVHYRFEEWNHVRIVFEDQNAEFHINSDEPVFTTDRLKREVETGGIGVYASNFAPAWFANFEYHALPPDYQFRAPPPAVVAAENLVMQWQVSAAFDWNMLNDTPRLGPEHTSELIWETMDSEPHGITNISRIRALAPGANAVFVRLRIESDSQRYLPLTFGYSDVARVFLNGGLLYQGGNVYQSRDYRYLGTIGLFDSVNLDLNEGVNELLIAVGESFGGWGIMATLDQADGVRLLP
jgi:hypothetical protein